MATPNDQSKPVRGSHIHILGMAYKRDIDDVRESPALDIALLLRRLGGHVTYSDPFVPRVGLDGVELPALDMAEAVAKADCVAIVTDHSGIDYESVVNKAKLIVDTRNALKNYSSDKIVRL